MKWLLAFVLLSALIPQRADGWVDWQIHQPLTAPRVVEAYGVELIGVFELPAGQPTHGTINYRLLPDWHGCWLIRMTSGDMAWVWSEGCHEVILPEVYR